MRTYCVAVFTSSTFCTVCKFIMNFKSLFWDLQACLYAKKCDMALELNNVNKMLSLRALAVYKPTRSERYSQKKLKLTLKCSQHSITDRWLAITLRL